MRWLLLILLFLIPQVTFAQDNYEPPPMFGAIPNSNQEIVEPAPQIEIKKAKPKQPVKIVKPMVVSKPKEMTPPAIQETAKEPKIAPAPAQKPIKQLQKLSPSRLQKKL